MSKRLSQTVSKHCSHSKRGHRLSSCRRRARPSVAVADNPEAWWRHAISMVVAECRKLRRRRTTLYAALKRRRIRERYTRLYKCAQSGASTYHDPSRKCVHTQTVAGHVLLCCRIGNCSRPPRGQDICARNRLPQDC